MKIKNLFFRIVLAAMFLSQTNAWANTVRVYGSPGQGYTDVTTNGEGKEIRRAHYGEDGVLKDHTEIDPATGAKETSTYADGKLERKVKTDANGDEREDTRYDKEGRVSERTTTDENGEYVTEEYQYDEKGRVIMVNKKPSGAGGGITESVDFAYDEEGNLEHVVRFGRDEQGNPRVDGKITWDKDGNITSREGNTDGLLDESKRHLGREFREPHTHVSRDPQGNTVIVRHNPDGSYDVTVINKEGKVISRQYYGSGRCYLGDECPMRHKDETSREDLIVTLRAARIPEVAAEKAKG